MTADRLESTLRAAAPDALVAYVTGGWPDPDRFEQVLEEVSREVDVVEIGVPFSDPMADGVTLQRTSAEALAAGASLRDLLARLRRTADGGTPRVLMSYLNPLLALGGGLVPALAAAGVSGLVVPDLPLEECDGLEAELAEAGLALVMLVAPTTPDARARTLATRSRGFTYVVTGLGVTGGDVSTSPELTERLAMLRGVSSAPLLAGFGIRRRAQVQGLRDVADGVIVGSALMRALSEGASATAFLRDLRGC